MQKLEKYTESNAEKYAERYVTIAGFFIHHISGVLAKKELGGILAVFNFINKSCRGKPCGHSGIIIRSLSNNFTNEIIALNFI